MLINKKYYEINEDEFIVLPHKEYTNLRILEHLGLFERLVSLLNEIQYNFNFENICFINSSHGGFIPLNCNKYQNIYILESTEKHKKNIEKNIKKHKLNNIFFSNKLCNKCDVLFFEDSILNNETKKIIKNANPRSIIITNIDVQGSYKKYLLKDTFFKIYVPFSLENKFKKAFSYFIEDSEILNYDNLLNLCIMVKNAGPQFENMLLENMKYIDRWTILDTGSTDETIKIINKVLVGKKKGTLQQDDFINFKDSRNQCLDLAGTECKFNIMLDDTYIIKGDLREFLVTVRGDQFADSYSMYIHTNDVKYASNRVIRADSGLRYLYKIHEVINPDNNNCIIIPSEKATIFDGSFDYMIERTSKRKEKDLFFLFQELDENRMDPRTYYYIGQTYNLMGEHQLAYEYYTKRGEFNNSGFIQERIDSLFEAARIANFKLKKPWNECLKLYEEVFKIDESRPDALYYIAVNYYNYGKKKKAYEYFKKVHEIGFPEHAQYGLKPTINFYFTPKYLAELCYEYEDYALGEDASKLFLTKNEKSDQLYDLMSSWYNIYKNLVLFQKERKNYLMREIPINISTPPIFSFIADGGFEKWSGSSINKNGVGGSETYIIEMARYIQKRGLFQVVVFCNCEISEIFENVIYKPINEMYTFLSQNYVHTCVISRFSEYIPLTYKSYIENVYFVCHDLTPSGIVIPLHNKLKNIFCMTEWHVKYLINQYPILKHLIEPFYNGVDIEKFNNTGEYSIQKIKNKFIYTSFPNRGLLELLKMWPTIYQKYPSASLHIYSDINGSWVNSVEPQKMKEIRDLLSSIISYDKNGMNVHYHGWVSKDVLAESWKSADIWFYPCTFMETFCISALEAAITKTFAVTNGLAALENTVGNRGLCVEGNASSAEWQESILEKLFEYMGERNMASKQELINKNYKWAIELSWKNQANKLIDNYVLKNVLEYKNEISWPNIFEEKNNVILMIDQINKICIKREKVNIMEVGTSSGTSLCHFLNLIHNSVATVIDDWSSINSKIMKMEDSFYKNVFSQKILDKVKIMKGKISDQLIELIRQKVNYDFIFVQNNCSSFEIYNYLYLSWMLLDINGILGFSGCVINDEDKSIDNNFNGIDKFFKEKSKDEYKILLNGKIVFVQKIERK